ncbi:hypothetical protein [Pectobacterium polaris]|uniref:hypothetical protein n=1 Tax=Pectobacterium polaris TaxID=2042057 RepID=UPI00068EF39B|nr:MULTISPECIES: hypothetical protein [Pectobacterium]
MAVFFNSQELTDKIKAYIKLLDRESPQYEESSLDFKINKICTTVLNEISQNPSYWDKYCKLTLDRKFSRINSILSSLRKDKDSVGELFSLLFSLVMEKSFRTTDSESNYLYNMRNVVSKYRGEFPDLVLNELNYTLYEMPFDIVNENYHDSDIREFAKASIIDGSIKQYIKEWSDKVEEQKEEVVKLSEVLEKQESAFNFVGLHLGFLHLSKEKKREMKSALKYTKMLGFLAVTPLLAEIVILSLMYFFDKKFESFYYFIPAFTLTIIFLYYFRISLSNYQSIKAQVNQIELRKTLCRFIQKYSDHAKKMKTSDESSLEKFESLIFSNIIPNEDKIPSTFDGMEQLSNLIKSTRG